ncbi:hypothetical protein C8J57DRAFT_1193426 [Mycena rebaudengoi]|nr:hypothetical protein C8J57DRAFT_1193426 [Mycena rebaudengoi]
MPESDSSGFSASDSSLKLQRGKACTNCRRRKIKCNSARPTCDQCHLRPPRSREPCQYPRANSPVYETPQQMLATIEILRARIEELEFRDPSRVFLTQPYNEQGSIQLSNSSGSTTPELPPSDMTEPPLDMVIGLVDIFLTRFADSGYFFLDPVGFRCAALLDLPFGNHQRPSPALLSAVYLWGCVLSHISPNPPYTEEGFLSCVLQNLPQDLTQIEFHPRIIIETIQCEVLLSYYYLHVALPVHGRYHSTAAMSLALTAGLHLHRRNEHDIRTQFALAHPVRLSSPDTTEAERTGAFWATVILNNYWVAAHGGPSAVPYGINIDTPWPSGSEVGVTVAKFLNGIELDGFSPFALLAKASILLEHIIAFSQQTPALDDSAALPTLDKRAHDFLSSLPPLPGTQMLLVTHVLTNLAIVHLHAAYLSTSKISRSKGMDAVRRVVDGVGKFDFMINAHHVDPILGPLFASLCSISISGVTSVYVGHVINPVHCDIEMQLGILMGLMASLAAYSPVIERCFMITRDAYATIAQPV